MKTRRHASVLIFILSLGTACGLLGNDNRPSVTILSPPDQRSILSGCPLLVESRAEDDRQLGRIVLYVNGLPTHNADVSGSEKTFRTVQSWLPETAGQYNVAVVAYDNKGQASDPATITISVKTTPTPAPASSSTAQPATPAPAGCTYNASFVADVTIPDNTELPPGIGFVKTWRLRNSGTCNWGQGFKFIFVEGEQMSGPAIVDVPPTAAGATIDISVSFKAPLKPGAYKSRWRMRTSGGQDFGQRPFVLIQVLPLEAIFYCTSNETAEIPGKVVEVSGLVGWLVCGFGEGKSLLVRVISADK